jgi:hypothetical protein
MTTAEALEIVVAAADIRRDQWAEGAKVAAAGAPLDCVEVLAGILESDLDERQNMERIQTEALNIVREYRPRVKYQIRGAYFREERDDKGGLVEEYWESYPVATLNRVGFELGQPDKWAIYRCRKLDGPGAMTVQDFVEDHDELVDAVEALERLEWRE